MKESKTISMLDELRKVEIAAYFNEDAINTCRRLFQYRALVAKDILICPNPDDMKNLLDAYNHVNEDIKKVLGL